MTLGEKEIYPFKETLLRDLTFRRITTLKIKLIAKGFKKIKCSKIHIEKKLYHYLKATRDKKMVLFSSF